MKKLNYEKPLFEVELFAVKEVIALDGSDLGEADKGSFDEMLGGNQ